MNNIDSYLFISSMLFCLGLFGVITRRNAIAVLMGVELILNAANITLIEKNSHLTKIQRNILKYDNINWFEDFKIPNKNIPSIISKIFLLIIIDNDIKKNEIGINNEIKPID